MTLIELIIVMIIVVVLMAIGVPSYRYVTTSNRVSTEVNSLLWDLQYARSEAVREGEPVTVCVSDGAASPTCASSGTTTWQNGWIVYSNPSNVSAPDSSDPILRVQQPFTSGDTFTSDHATSSITFNRNGFASLGTSLVTLKVQDASSNTLYDRCLELTQIGAMSTQTHASQSSC